MDNVYSGNRYSHSGFTRAQEGRDTWSSPAGKTSYDKPVNSTEYRENNDDYYISKKNKEDDRGSRRVFYPITLEWQKEKADKFKIKVVKSYKYGDMKSFYDKTAPKDTLSVQGDGNCFFRAISTCIIGSENEHMRIRELITKHVEENPEMYRTFLQSRGGMNQYLTSMRRPREWATDVEILAAATLLQTIIEVYFPCRIKGHIEYRWQTFKPLTHPDITHPVIYLSNKNDHFDPVLDVCTDNDEVFNRSTHNTESVHRSHEPEFVQSSRDPESVRRTHDQESDRRSHDASVYSSPLSSTSRSQHESSFDKIYGIPSYSSSRSSSRPSHPNVSQF